MDPEPEVMFRRAVALYNKGKYLECQQPLEDVYRIVGESEKPLVRAVIALACGMHLHFHRGGGRGVEHLLKRSLLEIEEFPSDGFGVDTGDLSENLRRYLEDLQTRRKPGSRFLDRWLVPRIRYRKNGAD